METGIDESVCTCQRMLSWSSISADCCGCIFFNVLSCLPHRFCGKLENYLESETSVPYQSQKYVFTPEKATHHFLID
jgi:hypothetical protein